ncbi:shikimate dehydrogenase [Aquamicrobium sp. LC103]|uniref:shikimate dehydrogenase family protein n=1 Tax=Aquamicrobium sp. LC103 TaxID=1120658 RepID=UPI00063ECD86|nr:shikimate dehydrogenase [Aquamicrobium sp. LC103]TKT76193.1 shikimate dehydrogenase [Aquamicrobium sp. LC103]
MNLGLNGETRISLIIGDPIAQVKSPGNLTTILARRGVNAIVAPAHVTAQDLPAFMQSVRLMRNLDAIVVTVPHKIAALDYCDLPSERAKFVGAVNVMRRLPDGRWVGDNTDGVGYLDGIAKEGFSVRDKKALLVGAGGAGSAIALEILARGASLLAVHDADADRRDRLLAKLAKCFPDRAVTGSADPRGFDLVANATPAGMRPGDPLPVDASGLSSGQFVADVITKPEVSPLVEHARSLGCGTMTGAGMFNAQADLLVDRILGIEAAGEPS